MENQVCGFHIVNPHMPHANCGCTLVVETKNVEESLLDNQGKEIQLGSLVAYNRSGELERGVVQAIKKGKKGWNDLYCYTFHIKGDRFDTVSKVTNSKNILVID